MPRSCIPSPRRSWGAGLLCSRGWPQASERAFFGSFTFLARCLELIPHFQASDKEKLQTDTVVGKIFPLRSLFPVGMQGGISQDDPGERGPALPTAPPRFSWVLHITFAEGFMASKRMMLAGAGVTASAGNGGELGSGWCHQPEGPGQARRRVRRDSGCSEQGKPARWGKGPHPARRELGEVTSSGLKPTLNGPKGLESNSLTRRSWV